MIGVQSRTWEYTADDLKDVRKITVQWKYKFPGKDVLARWERPKRTGFSVTWHLEDEKGQTTNVSEEEEELWGEKLDVEAMFATENVNFVAFVNMAEQAKEGGTEHESMMK